MHQHYRLEEQTLNQGSDSHGHNLVRDTGDVSPRFSRRWWYNMSCTHTFFSRFCIWRGFKNRSDFYHV